MGLKSSSEKSSRPITASTNKWKDKNGDEQLSLVIGPEGQTFPSAVLLNKGANRIAWLFAVDDVGDSVLGSALKFCEQQLEEDHFAECFDGIAKFITEMSGREELRKPLLALAKKIVKASEKNNTPEEAA